MSEQLDPVRKIEAALAEPFEPAEVKFKPAVVSGNRALALAYVDARVIQDRLDDVLGATGWQDNYDLLPDNSVVCKLQLRINSEWVTKVDVGGPSEQPDGGDRMKAAFSDALKRAAVKFGVGRYLYRLPQQWVDYDPQKRQIVRPPVLPEWALPESAKKKPAAPGTRVEGPGKSPPNTSLKPASSLPANGSELQRRLCDYDARLSAEGLCETGELVKHVVQVAVKAGHESDMSVWKAEAIRLAADETKAFEAAKRASSARFAQLHQWFKKAATRDEFDAACRAVHKDWKLLSPKQRRGLEKVRDEAAESLGFGDELRETLKAAREKAAQKQATAKAS